MDTNFLVLLILLLPLAGAIFNGLLGLFVKGLRKNEWVIGGVGTLNMMLDAVHERRGEIGLRLAVGARRRDVVTQFFLETLAITGFGGAVGVGLGIASCRLLGRFEVPDLVPVPILQWPVVVTAVFILVGVGLVAGIVPAVRAARVDPALTLRAE